MDTRRGQHSRKRSASCKSTYRHVPQDGSRGSTSARRTIRGVRRKRAKQRVTTHQVLLPLRLVVALVALVEADGLHELHFHRRDLAWLHLQLYVPTELPLLMPRQNCAALGPRFGPAVAPRAHCLHRCARCSLSAESTGRDSFGAFGPPRGNDRCLLEQNRCCTVLNFSALATSVRGGKRGCALLLTTVSVRAPSSFRGCA